MGVIPGVSRQQQSNIVGFRFMFPTVGDKAILGKCASRELSNLLTDTLGRGPERRGHHRSLCY